MISRATHLLAILTALVFGAGGGLAQAKGAQTAPRSVLVLEQEDHGRPAYTEFISGFRRSLASGAAVPTNVYAENLDLARFDAPGYREGLETWLRAKYRTRNLDAIIAIGAASVDFALMLRSELGRDIPIVYTAVMPEHAARLADLPATTGVVVEIDTRGTLEAALRLCPGTRSIAFVSGERGYAEIYQQARRDTENFAAGRLEFIPLTGLTFAELTGRMAALPPHTIVYYFALHADASGQVYNSRDALKELSRGSNAPIFSTSDTYLGYGTVGGSCMDYAVLGTEVAAQVVRVFQAAPGRQVPLLHSACNSFQFDWAEMNRRGLDPRLVPAGSDLRFRPPTLWQEHRVAVVTTIGGLLLQSVLIAALVGQMLRRRRAEQAVSVQREQLAHASRVAHMGQLASSLAHELSQPLGAILRNTEAAELYLRSDAPNLTELRSILADIRLDDQRAGEVIERMRSLLRQQAVKVQSLAVPEVVDRVIGLLRPDAIARRVTIETAWTEAVPAVLADRIHLKQVLLNLLLNAMDAVKDSPERRVVVSARLLDGRMVELAVSDSGPGLAPAQLGRIFEPFFTTKPDGMGMGLAVSRTIIEAHGGRITGENTPAGGANFRFTLPVAPGRVA